jgi:polyisoprenoid-binding protein YceI
MKQKYFILLMFLAGSTFAQKFYTSSAQITFTSEAPMEKIISPNKQVTCMLNTATKDLAFKVIMKSFEFERQGMYDHFNHEYLETDKFPNATFVAKITDNIDLTKNGVYSVTTEGTLTIHGRSKQIRQTGKIEVSDGKIILKSGFSILLSDFGVTVPNDYIKRISNSVQIMVNAVLSPYVR